MVIAWGIKTGHEEIRGWGVFALVLGAGDLIPLFCDTLFGEAGMKRLRLEGLEGGAAVAVLSFFPKTANASLYPCLLL